LLIISANPVGIVVIGLILPFNWDPQIQDPQIFTNESGGSRRRVGCRV